MWRVPDSVGTSEGSSAVHGNTRIFNDIDSLLDALAKQWQIIAEQSIADHGAFHVALAGGGTPRSFYTRLTKRDMKDAVAWDKVHIYFGDERCVPQDHEDSNYRMAHETLFSKVGIPTSQIYPMFSPSLNPEQNAAHYASLIEQHLAKDANGSPIFDLILLGMGEDGHTASLFPGTEILNEQKKSVAAQFVEKLGVWRVSLTYPTLNAARHVALLVVGENKANILSEISRLPPGTVRYPVQGINPQGDLQWFLDKAASHLVADDLNS